MYSHRSERWRIMLVRSLPLVFAMTLVGCNERNTLPTAALNPSAGSVLAVRGFDPDPLSNILPNTPGSCLVALRGDDGTYRSRSITIRGPGAGWSAAPVTRFAYRGWKAGIPEPALLTVCTVPDASHDVAVLDALFGGKNMTGAELRSFAKSSWVTDADHWGPSSTPSIMRGARPVYVTDGLLATSPATHSGRATTGSRKAMFDGVPCDPNAIIPDEGCDPGTTLDEVPPDPNTPPPDAEEPTSLVYDTTGTILDVDAVPGTVYPTVTCRVGADNPHQSTTAGYLGNINTKSWIECSAPMKLVDQTLLKRYTCTWWIFCGWSQIATSLVVTVNGGVDVLAIANSNCAWQKGWYRGEGYHHTEWMGQPYDTHTISLATYITCW
jgi:hypothetical protein